MSLTAQGRDVAAATPPHNPDQLAVTQGEMNQALRGDVEVADRLEAAESQLRALASVLGAAELLGESPTDGPGLSYIRARVDAVNRGEWGERKIEKYLERMAEARRPPVFDPAEMELALLRRFIYEETQKLGGRISVASPGPDGRPGGSVWWTTRLDDPEGRKRAALARERAEQRLAEHKTAQQNGAKHD